MVWRLIASFSNLNFSRKVLIFQFAFSFIFLFIFILSKYMQSYTSLKDLTTSLTSQLFSASELDSSSLKFALEVLTLLWRRIRNHKEGKHHVILIFHHQNPQVSTSYHDQEGRRQYFHRQCSNYHVLHMVSLLFSFSRCN